MPIPSIKVKILGQDSFSNLLGVTQKKLDIFGKRAKSIGRGFTTALTLPLTLAGGAAIAMSNDFNASMANVGTLIPGNLKRLNELKAGVQSLALETGKSTEDLASGLFQVISAFGDTNETLAKLRTISRGAVGGLAETTDALNLVSLITKSYGDVSDTASQKVLDLAFNANKLGQTTFPEMAASLGSTVPIAQALGVGLEELFGVMGTFTGVTGSTSEVTTQLRSFLGALIKPTTDMDKAFKKLNVSSGQQLIAEKGLHGAMKALMDITKPYPGILGKVLGRKEALTLMLSATGKQSDIFAEKIGKMSNVMGAADEAFREQTQGINKAGFALSQLKQLAVVMTQKFGDAVAPMILNFVDTLKPLVSWLGGLSQETKQLIFVFGVLVAVVGPILILIGTLATVFAALSSTVLIVVGVIAGLITAVGTLYVYWNRLVRFFKGSVLSVFDEFKTTLLVIGGPIGSLIYGAREIYKHWDKVLNLFSKISKVFSKTFGAVKEFFGFGDTNIMAEQRTPDLLANRSEAILSRTMPKAQAVTSKVDISFKNAPAGLKVFADDSGNLGDITRGLATVGMVR